MEIIQETGVLPQTDGTKTSDWIGQLNGGVIYAYDLGSMVSQSVGGIHFSKENFKHALKKVSRKIKK